VGGEQETATKWRSLLQGVSSRYFTRRQRSAAAADTNGVQGTIKVIKRHRHGFNGRASATFVKN
jgi:hypothetical protein